MIIICLSVGYNTIAVPADQLYAYGVQFTEVSGITELAIKDLLTVDQPKGAAKIGDNADQMWVWSGSSWKKYFYSSGRGSKVTGWCAEDNVNEITPATVKNGDGFFFRRASSADGNITISGAIKATSSDPVALAKDNLHLICNPWPVEIAIKDVASMIDVPKGAAKLGDNADQIWKWDTAGKKWVRYFYSSGRGSKVTGWCAEDNVEEITPDKIGVGQGFFFRRASSADGTLTFVKPAGL